MSESPSPSSVEVLDQIGLTAWVALNYRCVWDRWPPSLPPHIHKRLIDNKLVDVSDADPKGVPNDPGRAVAKLLRDYRGELPRIDVASIEDPQMADLMLGRPAPVDPNGPGPHESGAPFDAFAEDSGFDTENVDDPRQWIKSVRELAKDPAALRAVSAEMATMMGFLKKVVEALEKLPLHLKHHYRGELMAIGKDLVRDLNLGKVTEEQVHQTLLVFLQSDDDDDDPDPAPAPLPEDGEEVLA